MFCIKCGNRIADSSSFCIHCGTPVSQPDSSRYRTPGSQSSQYQASGSQSPRYQSTGYQNSPYRMSGVQTPPYQPQGYQTPPYQPQGYQTPPYQRYVGQNMQMQYPYHEPGASTSKKVGAGIGIALVMLIFVGVAFTFLYHMFVPNSEQAELYDYINNYLKEWSVHEERYVSAYNDAVADRYVDDATLYITLVDTIIPEATAMFEGARNYKPESKKLMMIHDTFRQYTNTVLTALNTLKEAASEGSVYKAGLSETHMKSAQTYADKFRNQLNAYASELGLEINWS